MMGRLALRKQIEPQSANRKNRLCVFVPLWFKPFPRIVSLVLALICVAASAHTLNSSAPPDSVSGSATPSAAQFTSAASSPFQVSSSSSAVLETITLRGAGNEVLREYQVDNGDELNRWKWTKDYVYAGSKLLASESPGGIRHYHLDHLGTTRVITDAAGTSLSATPYEYFPFGDEATVEPPNDERFRFTGHERDINDPLKPDYMHARYYYRGGSAGKFLSVDPGRDWDAKQPQSWNSYSYVRNDPLNRTDPTGKNSFMVSAANISVNVASQILSNDCLIFSQMVDKIASGSNDVHSFLDALAVNFTAARNSNLSEMFVTRNMTANTTFSDNGFKPQFQDGSNQVRHFTGGLVAGYKLGNPTAETFMNARERRWSGQADRQLNAVATDMGSRMRDPVSITYVDRMYMPQQKGSPQLSYRNLGAEIRRVLCDF